jgi:hypothetical protein
VVDLARSGSLPTAVAAADHALRHGLCTRDDLVREADAVPRRRRGRPQAALVVDLADGDSMSAGESLSRVQMFRLGVPRPRLQVRHEDAQGLIGKVKYRASDGDSAAQVSEVLWREKKREDRLRARGRVARWTWEIALEQERLGAVLAGQGVLPDPRASWFDLGQRRAG